MTELKSGSRSSSIHELLEMSEAFANRARGLTETDAIHSRRLRSLLAISEKVTEHASRLRYQCMSEREDADRYAKP